MSEIYDTHTLYVISGNHDARDVKEAIKKSLMEYDNKYVNTKIIVNVVKNRNMDYIGISYVYVSDTSAYHILCGNNEDGTSRITVFTPASKECVFDEITDKIWDIPYEERRTESWADEVESEYNEKETIVMLKPLVCPYIDGDEKYYLAISRAHVEINPELSSKTICINDIPPTITVDEIKAVFKDFSTTFDTVRKNKGKAESYPSVSIVSILKKRRVYITYSPRTFDALFANLMTKRVEIKNMHFYCYLTKNSE